MILVARILLGLLVVLAVLAGATLWRAARHEAKAEARFKPEGRFVQVNGRRVHAVVQGEGPDLVLLHGSSGNTRDMTFSLAGILAERYRVIVFDRPGLGYSDRLEPGAEGIVEQAAHLSAAVRALGAERPIVVGQSYGGAVALAWAVHHPDALSALVPVAAPSNPWSTELELYYRVLSSPWGQHLVVPAITAWVPDETVTTAIEEIFAPQSPPLGYSHYVGAPLTLRRVSLRANAMQRASLKEEIRALQPRYAEIGVPTEIVHGTADTTVGLEIHSEKLVTQIPGATLTRLDGIGHMPHHAARDAVIDAIDRAAERAGLLDPAI